MAKIPARLKWPPPAAKLRRAYKRLIDALGEIGLLLVAFAPLDWGFSKRTDGDKDFAVVLFWIGVFLLVVALIAEWFLPHE